MAWLDETLDPDPVIDAYKKDVDRTLLRENLRRTVEERIEQLIALQKFAAELRQAGETMRARADASKTP